MHRYRQSRQCCPASSVILIICTWLKSSLGESHDRPCCYVLLQAGVLHSFTPTWGDSVGIAAQCHRDQRLGQQFAVGHSTGTLVGNKKRRKRERGGGKPDCCKILTTHQVGVALPAKGGGGGWLIETELPKPPDKVAGDLISWCRRKQHADFCELKCLRLPTSREHIDGSSWLMGEHSVSFCPDGSVAPPKAGQIVCIGEGNRIDHQLLPLENS